MRSRTQHVTRKSVNHQRTAAEADFKESLFSLVLFNFLHNILYMLMTRDEFEHYSLILEVSLEIVLLVLGFIP
ncbi:hypothetical protein ACS0TY_030741 [Phlomoides rotata]